jgi:hypothetical protein
MRVPNLCLTAITRNHESGIEIDPFKASREGPSPAARETLLPTLGTSHSPEYVSVKSWKRYFLLRGTSPAAENKLRSRSPK